MQKIQTKSFNLACHVRGNENAEKLVLVLPGRLDTKDYAHMMSHIDFLAEKGFLAVTFDPPGTWGSDGDISEYTETNYSQAIGELIEYFGNKQTLLVGHSRGGSMAMYSGCKFDQVIGFVSIMSNVESSKYDPSRVVDGTLLSRRDLPSNPTGEEKKEFYLPVGYFEDAQQHDRLTPLKSCTKPKMFVAGLQDSLVTPETVKSIHGIASEPKVYHEVDFGHDYRKSAEIIKEVEGLLEGFIRDSF